MNSLEAKRRRIEAGVKAKVALAAVRGDRTTGQLVSQLAEIRDRPPARESTGENRL